MRISSGTAMAGCVDRKSTRLNSSHLVISYAVFCLKKKSSEDLHPDFLRDVGGQLGITTKPANDGVDVGRMLRPKPLHSPFVACNGTLEVKLIEWHLGLLLSHTKVC